MPRSRLPLSLRHEELTVHAPTVFPPHAVTLVHAAAEPPAVVPLVPVPVPLVPEPVVPPAESEGTTELAHAPKLTAQVTTTTNNEDWTFLERTAEFATSGVPGIMCS